MSNVYEAFFQTNIPLNTEKATKAKVETVCIKVERMSGLELLMQRDMLSFPRNLKSPKTTIHVNFCFALLAANIFLLIGSRAREIKVNASVAPQ